MAARVLTKSVTIGLLSILVIAEGIVRLAGLVDFPLYDVDDEIGYIPSPNQHGCFLKHKCWVFNEHSMGTALPWNPDLRSNILLIGNSIVMGGNHFDQPDKLGPLLQQNLGSSYRIWPIAAGGWTNVNEAVYLKRNDEVLRHTNFFVWEFMAGGLSQSSTWRGQYVFPTKHPSCALCYVFRRYGLGRFSELNPRELPPSGAISAAPLAEFDQTLAQISQVTERKQPGILFIYPNEMELRQARSGQEWLAERAELEALSRKHGLRIVDVSAYPEWTEELYREGWHPTIRGNTVLAKILAAAIRDSVKQEPLN